MKGEAAGQGDYAPAPALPAAAAAAAAVAASRVVGDATARHQSMQVEETRAPMTDPAGVAAVPDPAVAVQFEEYLLDAVAAVADDYAHQAAVQLLLLLLVVVVVEVATASFVAAVAAACEGPLC